MISPHVGNVIFPNRVLYHNGISGTFAVHQKEQCRVCSGHDHANPRSGVQRVAYCNCAQRVQIEQTTYHRR